MERLAAYREDPDVSLGRGMPLPLQPECKFIHFPAELARELGVGILAVFRPEGCDVFNIAVFRPFLQEPEREKKRVRVFFGL